MREFAHQNVYWASFWGFFQHSTAKAPEPIFTQYVKRRSSAQGCAFYG